MLKNCRNRGRNSRGNGSHKENVVKGVTWFSGKNVFEIYNVGIVKKPIRKILRSGIAAGEITWMRHRTGILLCGSLFVCTGHNSFIIYSAEEYIFWERKGRFHALKYRNLIFRWRIKVVIEEPVHPVLSLL